MNERRIDDLFKYLELLIQLRNGKEEYICTDEIRECIDEIRKEFKI